MSIKYKLLILMSVILALSFGALMYLEIITEEKDIVLPSIKSNFLNLEKVFYQRINDQINNISAAREIFANDEAIKSYFMQKDRNKLYQYVYPLFQTLKNQYDITHIYFILPDNHVFLRMHSPNIYADIIERKSFKITKSVKQPIAGIELGRTSFALRVIGPYFKDHALLGFVEFSKNIDNFVSDLKKHEPKIENIFVLVNKKDLDPKLIANEDQDRKIISHWNDFDDYVIVNSLNYETVRLYANTLKSYLNDTQLADINSGEPLLGINRNESKTISFGGFPLFDASDRNIGFVIASVDISDLYSATKKDMILHILSFSFIFLIMLLCLYFFTKRTIVNPIHKLSLIVTEITKKGKLSLRSGIKRKDELGRLSNYLDRMTEDLQKTTVSKTYMDKIINNMLDTLVVVDNDDKIKTINNAAENLLGYTEKELIGRNISEIIPKPPLYANIKENPIINCEITYRSKKGILIPMLASFSTMTADDGKVEGIIIIAKDITEHKKNESEREQLTKILIQKNEELERANKELDNFVHLASHDLRSPVITISSLISLLEKHYKDNIDAKEYEIISKIKNTSNRISELIDKLLTLTRVTSEKSSYEFIEIKDVVNSVKELLDFDIKKYKVQITVQDNIPPVECDRIKIGELFLNLISNAIKYSSKNKDDNPKIDIGYTSDNEFHRFYIKDNGIGIDPKYHQKIFNAFSRLHSESEYSGTGIGLSIVKRVIEEHGGNIWIESEEGKGATFYFTLLKHIPVKIEV